MTPRVRTAAAVRERGGCRVESQACASAGFGGLGKVATGEPVGDRPRNRSWRKGGREVRDRSRPLAMVQALIARFGDARGELIPSARERRLGLVQGIGHAAAWAVRQRPDGRQALYAAPGARQTGKGRPMSAVVPIL